MTDFSNPPPFEDPVYRCPKCLRSDRFAPRYREGDAGLPATITWTHGCGYSVVTQTADGVARAGTGGARP